MLNKFSLRGIHLLINNLSGQKIRGWFNVRLVWWLFFCTGGAWWQRYRKLFAPIKLQTSLLSKPIKAKYGKYGSRFFSKFFLSFKITPVFFLISMSFRISFELWNFSRIFSLTFFELRNSFEIFFKILFWF